MSYLLAVGSGILILNVGFLLGVAWCSFWQKSDKEPPDPYPWDAD